eukprot:TRINITY_DN2031_c0_g1_i3.p1 TRINITY_DN2031_c0_g1~~TRINITY_DN2031_c0_g1_i3.p1  ORF type:complete len:480 (-),score=125.36 TRINITY_DN2031_c0_g1_i3:321-1760(-)
MEVELKEKSIQLPKIPNEGQKRCKRCHYFLNDKEWYGTKCVYHPGVFSNNAWEPGWSCCNREVLPILTTKDFLKYQVGMEALPRTPGANDYLKDAVQIAADNYDAILASQQKAEVQPPSSPQPKMITDSNAASSASPRENNPESTIQTVTIDALPVVSVNAFPSDYQYSVTTSTVTVSDDTDEEDEQHQQNFENTPISVSVNSDLSPNYEESEHSNAVVPSYSNQQISASSAPRRTGVQINNGEIVLSDQVSTGALVLAYNQLSATQRNTLVEQLDREMVETFKARYTERDDNKTLSLKEKTDFRNDPELSPFSQNSIGCTVCDHHAEDAAYSAIITQFPIRSDVEAASEPSIRVLPEQLLARKGIAGYKKTLDETPTSPKLGPKVAEERPKSPSEENPAENDEKPPEFFVHMIQKEDTLVGLSLKYSIPVPILQRVNHLSGANLLQISHMKSIRIPTNGKYIPSQTIRPPTKRDIALK